MATLYHVYNIFGVVVNVMINNFAATIKCILMQVAVSTKTERVARLVSNSGPFMKLMLSTN